MISLVSPPSSPFQKPSFLYEVATIPVQATLSRIHKLLVVLRGFNNPSQDAIRIVCISDTHTYTPELPPGDVLIHAGDLTNAGTALDIQAQIDWLSGLSHSYKYIIVICGNHDSYFDPRARNDDDSGRSIDFQKVHYLQHSSLTLDFPSRNDRRLVVFGAPQIPACGGSEMAFQYKREGEDAWTGTVPSNVDILITHTPPRWHLDLPIGVGCDYLLKEVWRVQPQLHVFGHVHAGRGQERVFWDTAQMAYERVRARRSLFHLISISLWLDIIRVLFYDILGIAWQRIWVAESNGTLMVNSSYVNYHGKPQNKAQVIEL